MGIADSVISEVKQVLINSLTRKFQNHNPEPSAMPFHTRLLGKDRLALYSFIHSLNTNFGTSIFEPVACVLGRTRFLTSESQQAAGQFISSEAHLVIQRIMDDLATASREPNKVGEIEEIRSVCQKGHMHKVKPTKVDLKLVSHCGEVYLFDIKTAKPNAGGFKEFKRTMLEWVAATLADDPQCKVNSIIAIPYNPYAPEKYKRWTMRGMMDLDKEVMVAEDFWDFLGGQGSYDALLDIFEIVGIEMRPDIDNYFAKFQNSTP